MTDTLDHLDLYQSPPPKQRIKSSSRQPQAAETVQEAPKLPTPSGKQKVRAAEKQPDDEDSDVINTASDNHKIVKKSEDRSKRRNGAAKVEPVGVKEPAQKVQLKSGSEATEKEAKGQTAVQQDAAIK